MKTTMLKQVRYFKAVLFIFMNVAAIFAQAQSYHPFPDSNAIWNTTGNNVFTNAKYEFRYGMCGDTVINSKTYSKVYSLVDTILVNPLSTYFGAIREDADKKVWFLMPGYDETILYDFSAQPGDTIRYQTGGALCGTNITFWPQTPHYLTVVSIDSILLENGEYRKRWHLSGGIMSDQWVEGFGSIFWFGLFNPLISDIALCGDSYDFACFRQNYETIYLNNTNCGTCYCNIILSSSDIFDNHDSRLTISPNPADNEIEISFSDHNGPYCVRILDLKGRQVAVKTEIHTDNQRISTSALLAGEYVVMVCNGKNEIVRQGKLMIK
jgi:hypothetical protein